MLPFLFGFVSWSISQIDCHGGWDPMFDDGWGYESCLETCHQEYLECLVDEDAPADTGTPSIPPGDTDTDTDTGDTDSDAADSDSDAAPPSGADTDQGRWDSDGQDTDTDGSDSDPAGTDTGILDSGPFDTGGPWHSDRCETRLAWCQDACHATWSSADTGDWIDTAR